jgi:hypothetical protein
VSVRYDFTAKLWRSPGAAGWHFVALPVDLSAQIRTLAGSMMNAFGSLRVKASIGGAAWKTSLFYDTKRNAFLLPVKADVRRKARIEADAELDLSVEIEI